MLKKRSSKHSHNSIRESQIPWNKPNQDFYNGFQTFEEIDGELHLWRVPSGFLDGRAMVPKRQEQNSVQTSLDISTGPKP